MIKVTVFTPTYNRKHLLPNLFESLKRQTCKDFIWLIVDDGSSDGTEELFNEWKSQDVGFKIEYIKKLNGGKHTAIEKANEVCSTDYIICVDSDDSLTENAVKQMYKEIDIIDKMDDVCGVVTRRAKPNGEPFNVNWVPNEMSLYFYELAKKYGYSADTSLLFKTNIVNKFHFPIFKEERFVTESVYYNQFLYNYKMYASNDLYYLAEYMSDGYTAQGLNLFFKNPAGYLYALKQDAYFCIKYKTAKFKRKVGFVAVFYAWKKVLGLKERFPKDYKIPFIYKTLGKALSFIPEKNFKAKKMEYCRNQINLKGE